MSVTDVVRYEQSSFHADDDIVRALVTINLHATIPLVLVEGTAQNLENARILWANHKFNEVLQTDSCSVIGSCISTFITSTLYAKSERLVSHPVNVRIASGAMLEFNASIAPATGNFFCISLGAIGDNNLAANDDARLSVMLENSPVATMLSETGMRLFYVNDAMCQLFNATASDLLGMQWMNYLGDSVDTVFEAVQSVFEGEEPTVEISVPNERLGERFVRLRLTSTSEPGAPVRFIGTFDDITDSRRFEEALNYQSRHDSLTGLPNRLELSDWLDKRLQADNETLACYFIDLDRFKEVNDTLGHSAGDELIYVLAQRIRNALRPGDLVARWGGDEFIVMCSNISSEKAALSAGRRMLTAVSQVVSLHGQIISPTMSIGVVRASADSTADSLLRDADIAMYQAKRAGKNRVMVFDTAQRNAIHDDWQVSDDLRRALSENELEVHYQPIVPLYQGSTISQSYVEALLRWNHPTRGKISPSRFCALAEANNLVNELGEYVIRTACAQMRAWLDTDENLAPSNISVNVSALQLRSMRPVHYLRNMLEAYSLNASRISVEITETALMDNAEVAIETLNALREMGVSVSIDDFGTGHSSLSHLAQLPVDCIKIDKSFVDQMVSGQSVILNAIVQMTKAMNLRTVAEGVENASTAQLLAELGCCYAQGWHYAKAMNGNDYLTWKRMQR